MTAVDTRYRSSGSNTGFSRLAAMQERMRENIRLEKESKMLEMVARRDAEREDIINRVTKTSISSLSASMNSLSFSNAGQGRVRKMLEERRNNPQGKGYASPKGYDKSYPLDPVNRDEFRPSTRGIVSNGRAVISNGRGIISNGRGITSNGRGISLDRNQRNNDASMIRSRSQVALQRATRGNSKLTTSTRSFEGLQTNNNYHKSTSSLMERKSPVTSPTSIKSSPGHRSSNGISSGAPTVSRGSYLPKKPVNVPKPPPRRYGLNRKPVNENNDAIDSKPQINNRNILPKKTPTKQTSNVKSRNPLPTPTPKFSNKASVEAVSARKNDGMPSCSICGRTFASDRLEKHQQICSKSKIKSKKRKIFDPTKMRTQGTEAEQYIARGTHKKEPPKKKSDWRKKHNELIQTLRAAKGVSGYVAPPIDTTDYVQCPHCGRKFSEAAGDRHIPKCANIQSNKKRR